MFVNFANDVLGFERLGDLILRNTDGLRLLQKLPFTTTLRETPVIVVKDLLKPLKFSLKFDSCKFILMTKKNSEQTLTYWSAY